MLFFDARDYGATPDDNTDDTAAIQAALDAAHAAGGGHVYLGAGTYTISGTGKASDGALRVYSNTEFSGDGMGKTILKLADGWSSKITGLIRTPVNQVTENVVIRDLSLDGNRDNTTADVDGIMTGVLPGKSEHDNNILIERVEIHDVSRIAFNPHEQTQNLTIRDSVAHHNSWDGFIADFITNAVYENNVAYANDRHGFNVVTHSSEVVLKDNVAYDNGENGIVIQRGAGSQSIDGWEEMLNHDVLVINNEVYGNGNNGILLKQVEYIQVVGNTIYDNGDDGVQLEGARFSLVADNAITANINGVELRAYTGSLPGPDTSHDNVIVDNIIIATKLAVDENNTTTINNVYAGNIIGDQPVDLGTSATYLVSSDGINYELLTIAVTYPDNYNGTIVTEEPVITEPVVDVQPAPEPVQDVQKDTVVKDTTQNSAGTNTEGVFLSGTNQNETLEGTAGDDTLKGRSGDDVLVGGDGKDYLEGNAGNDFLIGGHGADILKGSNGLDTFVFKSIDDAGDTVTDFRYDEKIDVETILKGAEGFTLETALDDGFVRLEQNGSNTLVFINTNAASGGQETLLATLLKTDASKLGAGNFILPESTSPAVETVDTVIHQPETENAESVVTASPLSLSGNNGDNLLVGDTGDDTLKGRRGDDTLNGGKGNDTLWGNDGQDTLNGGSGADWMKGGDGFDTFVFDQNALDAVDTVADFRQGKDTLELRDILFGFDPLTDAINDFVNISNDGSNSILAVDIDGKENGVHFTQIATLEGASGTGSAADLLEEGSLIITNTNNV